MTYVIADAQRFRVCFCDESDEVFLLPQDGDVQGTAADRVLPNGQQLSTSVVLMQKLLHTILVAGANCGVHLFALVLSLRQIQSDIRGLYRSMINRFILLEPRNSVRPFIFGNLMEKLHFQFHFKIKSGRYRIRH